MAQPLQHKCWEALAPGQAQRGRMNLLDASQATCWGQAQLGHLVVQEPQAVEGVKPALCVKDRLLVPSNPEAIL